jgi:Cu2+-containing amine oxidase
MKINKFINGKYFLLVLVITLSINNILSLNLKAKMKDDDSSDDERVPIINVHMEEPDRDPLEVKRIEEERRFERNRIRDMELMEEQDKRSFQQIIELQNSQIAKLSQIADRTGEILNSLTGNKEAHNNQLDQVFKGMSKDNDENRKYEEEQMKRSESNDI